MFSFFIRLIPDSMLENKNECTVGAISSVRKNEGAFFSAISVGTKKNLKHLSWQFKVAYVTKLFTRRLFQSGQVNIISANILSLFSKFLTCNMHIQNSIDWNMCLYRVCVDMSF